MKILLAIALFVSFNANLFSPGISANDVDYADHSGVSQVEEKALAAYIVMEDMIAKANSGDPTDVIIKFEVYDITPTPQLRYEDASCTAATCFYDLSGLPSGTYKAQLTTASNKVHSDEIAIP